MLQAIMTNPGKIVFREVERPKVGASSILMETKRIGICGSDIHVFHGMHPYTTYPVIQGHEVSGIVSKVGKKVDGISEGDKLTFTPQVVCGNCYPCRHGMYHICENLKVMGFQTDGAAQEYYELPEWNVVKLHDAIPLDHGAMIEPAAVGVHAVQKAPEIKGKKVLVLGAGTIGNLLAQVAKSFGAKLVMITDILDYKLEKAKECGIDFAINTDTMDLNEALLQHFGRDRADVIFECVGVQTTIDQSISNARKGTPIIIVGVFGEKPSVDLGLVQDRELKLIGTLMYQKPDFEKAMQVILNGDLYLDELITHRFSFRDYLSAYQAIEDSQGECMKVMIEMD